MEQLPQSLSYSASKQALRMNRFICRPTGTDTASPGDTFRITLPSKSLINLSSLNLCFNLELSTLVDDCHMMRPTLLMQRCLFHNLCFHPLGYILALNWFLVVSATTTIYYIWVSSRLVLEKIGVEVDTTTTLVV